MALLELENVHAYYGNIHALKGVSLNIDKGEMVTLIGANGAGKSSTLRATSGPYVRVRDLFALEERTLPVSLHTKLWLKEWYKFQKDDVSLAD